jgi:photosystem II stability/assembly factor-like uncharacterized protein
MSKSVLISALLLITHHFLSAQVFTQLHPGIPTNQITDIVEFGADTLFATGYNWSLQRSTDAGATWTEMLSGSPRFDLVRGATDGRYLFALTRPFRDTEAAWSLELTLIRYDPRDGTWTALPSPITGDPLSLRNLDISGGGGVVCLLQKLYLPVRDSLILSMSSDGGATWSNMPLPADIDPDRTTTTASLFFRNARHGMVIGPTGTDTLAPFITRDGGLHWSRMRQASGAGNGIAGIPRAPFHWFADSCIALVNQQTDTWLTTDLGDTWRACLPVPTGIRALRFASTGVGYCVGYSGGVFKTYDFGQSWIRVRDDLALSGIAELRSCASLRGDGTLLCATHLGQLWRTTTGGLDWADVRDFDFLQPRMLQFVDTSVGFMCPYDGKQGARQRYLKSTDGGRSWRDFGNLGDMYAAKIGFADRSVGYILESPSTGADSVRRVFKTTDGGDHWSASLNWQRRINADIATTWRGSFAPSALFVLLPTSDGGIVRTTDGGVTWEHRAAAFDTSGNERAVFLLPRDAASSWLATRHDVYTSTDDGHTWSPVITLPRDRKPDLGVIAIFDLGGDSIAVSVSTGRSYNDSILVTADDGARWTGYTSVTIPQMATLHADGSGLQYFSGEFRRTADGWRSMTGAQWEYHPSAIQEVFFLDRWNAWAASMTTIFHSSNGGVNWTRQAPVPPSSPCILSCYPHPVIHGSAAQVELAACYTPVRLELLDMLGRVRRILYEGEFSRSFTVLWLPDIAPGMYILSLKRTTATEFKRIIVQ